MLQNLFVSVLLDQNLSKPLDYSIPQQWEKSVEIGMRVEVPLRNRLVKGTITALKQTSSFSKVLPLSKVLSIQAELSPSQWKLAQWISLYYATSLQKVLKCFIPPHIRKEVKEKKRLRLSLSQTDAKTLEACGLLRRKSPIQAQVLDALLQQKKGVFLSELLSSLNITQSPVDALIKKKWIHTEWVSSDEDLLLEEDFFQIAPKKLNDEQRVCLEKVVQSLEKNAFSSHLIYGITGSGKTEIYLQAIAKTLEMGKSAILLVPEVALTSQTIERFRSRFTEKIAVLHHRKSLGERNSAWEGLRDGKIRLAIGARSAIFAPLQNLGLIIVDEEHDNSYKQSDEMPCYQGRDVAVKRAQIENCTILLGSATPSIESFYNAQSGKYQLHTLRLRAASAHLPKVQVVDMKRALEIHGGFTHFSDELLDRIKQRVEAGEQTLLLLNKRGYHRMQLCASCRTIAKCPHCDLSLTYHKDLARLQCHLCDFTKESLRECPQCKAKESLQFKGFGTEHVEKSLHAILPGIRTLRMDKDTTKEKHSHEELFKLFRSHKADVLIGTQMIAKGFHFPLVTLVGVLNLDASLSIPDFRSPEQIFQLLIQVSGRAGRAELPGEVILQTFLPDHPVICLAAKQNYDAFYQQTIEERRLFGYPPFCRFAKFLFSSDDALKAEQAAEKYRAHLQKDLPPNTELFPVVPSGHAKVKDLYRFQFLIKTPHMTQLVKTLATLESGGVKIDIDPISTFF